MKFPVLSIVLSFFCFFAGCVHKADNKNSEITVFALSPSLAETIFFLGKGGLITGAGPFSNYPDEAKNIPVVANVSDLNLEYTLRLKPDIVFLMPSQSNIGTRLDKIGVRSVIVSQESLDDILESVKIIGELTGAEKRAGVLYDSLYSVLQNYKSAPGNTKVLISAGRDFGSGVSYIYSVGKAGFLHDIIELLGHSNALDTKIPYPKIGAEAVMSLNPDIILDLVPSNVALTEEELLRDWKLYKNTEAAQKGNIIVIKGDHTTIPGPRIFDLIKELKEKGL